MSLTFVDDESVDFMLAKAKSCPFCGMPATGQKAGEWVALGCPHRSCPGVSAGMRYRGTADALARWNHRAPLTAPTNEEITP